MADHFPEIVLGTMTFGAQADEASSARMLAAFTAAGHRWIDTAHIYTEGASETILGRILPDYPPGTFQVASKAHPGKEGGGLAPERLTAQLEGSLTRLRREALDLFYLHRPDPRTPLEKTLEACHDHHRRGRFRALGLSNFPPAEVLQVRDLCQARGWIAPTVYQGMYNAITRAVEPELLPLLSRLGIAFQAFNPLAGGLLTGKYAAPDRLPEEGRFVVLDFYQERYWKAAYFEALEVARDACRQAGIPLAEAALRWLTRHSGLTAAPGQAVILGASRPEQLAANLAAVARPPLPAEVAAALDRAWELARPACPPFAP